MTELFDRLNAAVPFSMNLAFFVRILAACVCGAVVGIERSKRFKEAGIRTHCVVACAAAIFMILSKYCFADLSLDAAGTPFPGDRGADPARIAAQIVSGIGFLGAGVIFKNGSSVKGLTTAAGIWATAAIGMAIGAGMYVLGFFSTAILVAAQILTHRFTVGNDSYSVNRLVVRAKDSPELRTWLHDLIRQQDAQPSENSITKREDGTILYNLALRASNKNQNFSALVEQLEDNPEIISCSCTEE